MATATNKAFIDYYKVGSTDVTEIISILMSTGAGHPARKRVGGIYGITQNRAAFDFPSHRIQSVSSAMSARAHNRDAETINDIIKSTYVPAMQDVELEGQRIEPPKQLSWYVQLLVHELMSGIPVV